MKIKVAELIHSLQGEGATRGNPATFIRFPNCNLLCKGSNWICDSLAFRNKYTEYTYDELANELDLEAIEEGYVHLIFTGGEPLLPENYEMMEAFLWYLIDERYINFDIRNKGVLELETNGTILLDKDQIYFFNHYFKHINCSPKLTSSGADDTRYNKKALEQYKKLGADFKFVISNDKDFEELESDKYSFLTEEPNRIYLMPATLTDLSGDLLKQRVWEYAVKHHYNYTDRDHINVWGLKAGV